MFGLPSTINQNLFQNHFDQILDKSNPCCIVIGCKNGNTQSISGVKFFQIPDLVLNPQIARQWYINTLREDLLEKIINQTNKTENCHFVCIEHFDEESFLISKNSSNQIESKELIPILKEDAVPSLFEIEVFQKMIAHQEQFALNQQQKLQISQVETSSQAHPKQQSSNKTSLLQNLILNIEPQQFTAFSNTSSNSNNFTFNNNKRARMDPDLRAALIQRVPKAVKRTALAKLNQPASSQQIQPKLQKAVKHTYPRQQVIDQFTNETTNNKIQKAVKHTSPVSAVNSLLKDLLPPPIMQSTKKVTNLSTSKAVKHTSSTQGQVNTTILQNKQPLSQQSLNQSNLISSSISNANKITITTTYVYKRVSQMPEIDLNLECEEEEIVYVKPIPKEEPKPTLSNVEEKKTNNEKSTEKQILKDKEEKTQNCKEISNSTELASLPILKDEIKTEKSILNALISGKSQDIKDLKSKSENEGCLRSKSVENKAINNEKLSITKKNDLICKENENYSKNNSTNATVPKQSNCPSILGKFYSRRMGAMDALIENKNKTKFSTVPFDLRVGNYPAKCNVCDIILGNNIELTSHICSHLESHGSNENEPNTYISPFDAVTTTCGVCGVNFSNPFRLIKHLDADHLEQLAEYKCRICEKQHQKLSELLEHLKETHSSQEMPYRCDACGFRTSFYADAIYHIKKEHSSTLRHFCPYCLKSLILPFNKKLGHVQCNIFYSHLITHFNKHENNQIIPSKCKHCTKCILHVRNIRDHLIHDHNTMQANKSKLNSNDKETNSEIIEKPEESPISSNIKKRKRSFNFTDDDSLDSASKQELTPNKIEKEIPNKLNEFVKKNSDKTTNRKFSCKKIDNKIRSKLIRKNKLKNCKLNLNSCEYLNLIKKTQFIKSAKLEEKIDEKSNLNEEESKTEQIPAPVRKQKALKQTNIKPSVYRKKSRIRTTSSDNNNSRSSTSSPSTDSSQIISGLLLGNIKFSCKKNQFKCIECNESNLKSHFRTDYECHQCKYNTKCSKSFEFHLHGHLKNKRVALWNKQMKSKLELYNCPCGFKINSAVDNNSQANTGNKIAEHLLNCEYKYCYFQSNENEHEINFEEHKEIYSTEISNKNIEEICIDKSLEIIQEG